MKFALACLIASLSLVSVYADNIRDREGFYYEQRPRLGHFKEQPFIDLYVNYASAFVKPNHPDRVADDFRNYLPSAEECVNFFRKFRIDEYVVRDLSEFVVLDACLGYLFESTYQQKDREASKIVEENLDNFLNDEKLKALYENTKVNSLEGPAKECVGDLLLNSILVKKQYSDVVCNNHYIQVFVQFADCQSSIPNELRNEDSYLNEIYDLVKKRAVECFDYEIGAINRAVRNDYAGNVFNVMSNNFFSKLRKPLKQQAKTRMYPKPIMDLLSAVQGTTQEINLRGIHNILRGISMEEPNFVNKLKTNMAAHATKTVKPKKDSKKVKEDPDGSVTYRRYIDDMCRYFRRSDREDYYDYATPIIRMNRLLAYPDVFGINSKQFINKLLVHSYESGALYLSVCACNVLTFTEAVYDEPVHNGPLHFKVSFKPDTKEMIRWPDAGYY